MLKSMTGFGEARRQDEKLSMRVEIRAVNNRHLKLVCKLPDGYASIESQIEARIRKVIRRGTLNLTLHIDHEAAAEDYQINDAVLSQYYRQLSDLSVRLHDIAELHLSSLLVLPGVVNDNGRRHLDLEEEWPIIEKTVDEAVEKLNEMRTNEGAAMCDDLLVNCDQIEQELADIESRSPEIVKAYETRLLERISQLLEQHDVEAEPSAVIREVAIFADRVDTSEEVVRLRSHLKQFRSITQTEKSPGRKLEFLIQEFLRETNTIGSKANDAEVARHVVQIKTLIERMREMIQNVE